MALKGESVDMQFADPEDCIISQPLLCDPERNLWFAVIQQAVLDVKANPLYSQSENCRNSHQASARAWFRSEETGPGSLKWIIQMTGLRTTVTALRRRLLNHG